MGLMVEYPGEPAYRPRPPIEPDGDSAVSPMLLFRIIRRHKYSILLTATVLSAMAIGGAMTLQPTFVATASVLMQERKATVSDFPTEAGMIATDSVAVRTQVDILRSADLARTVARTLHLVDVPEFSPHPGRLDRLLDTIRSMDTIGVLGWIGLSPRVLPPPPTPAEREEVATQILLGVTSIVNDGRSYVIDIKVAARSAKLSADLANTFAESYLRFNGMMKSDEIRQANSFFDERISALKEKMRAAEHAVPTYRAENDLVEDRAASSESRSVTLIGQRMAQINSDLVNATADRAKLEASLSQITRADRTGGGVQSAPEVVGSSLIQSLRGQQAALGAREAALAMSRGSNSPDLIAVRASQRDIADKIAAEIDKTVASLRNGVAAARAREVVLRTSLRELQTQVETQAQAEVKLIELQNEAEIARTMYSSYFKRAEETANQIGGQEPDALLVSRAGIPLGPAPPTRKAVIAIGVVVSFVLAILLALIRERMQSGFRTAEQLEQSVGVETLGFVPKVGKLRDALRFENRRSAFSEAIISIRTMLRLNARRGSQVVMVTSAIPQEGKTFFSSCLARNAALAGERTLLIDCDLRRPTVTRNIIATETQALDDVTIRRDSFSALDIITLTLGMQSPQDLFASAQMRNLIAMLRERYDLILLDTPPVLAVSDVRVLSGLADIVLLVVCWRTTPQRLVNNAVSALRNSGAKLAGTVMTQVDLHDLDVSDGAQAYIHRNYYLAK